MLRSPAVIAALLLGIAFAFAIAPARALPPAGTDVLPVAAVVEVGSLIGAERAALTGWAEVTRGEPRLENGMEVAPLEVTRLRLRGATRLGAATVVERENQDGAYASLGELRSAGDAEFPATSFFDLFVDVSLAESPFGPLMLHNETPLRLEPEAPHDGWPPFGATYALRLPPAEDCLPLLDESNEPNDLFLCVHGLTIDVAPVLPSFSVARGGPEHHHSAEVLALLPANLAETAQPPYVRITCGALGLTAAGCEAGGDDLDALSYGDDAQGPGSSVRFSVGPGAQGAPGSAVEAQSDCPPAAPGASPEPEPDVFTSALDGGNELLLDGNGPVGACDSAFPLGLLESIASRDDLDALAARDPSFVDVDVDGVPERPVYLSLDAASPSLAAFGFSPADVLVTARGAQPAVYAPAAALGLAAGDDVDALCLRESGDGAFGLEDVLYFSLAPGSPALAAAGASAGDLLAPGEPPVRIVRSRDLGLAAGDDVDALDCPALIEAGAGPGDANCDGRVDSIDALLILQLDVGLVDSLPCASNADVNGDRAANGVDATLVLQYHARLLGALPV